MRTNISTLKQGLSAALEKVKSGRTITVLERKTPIARIVPFKAEKVPKLSLREPTRKFVDLNIRVKIKSDPAKIIAEDREEKWFTT